MKLLFLSIVLVFLLDTRISSLQAPTTASSPNAPELVNISALKDFTHARALIDLFDTIPELGNKKLSELQRKALNALFPAQPQSVHKFVTVEDAME